MTPASTVANRILTDLRLKQFGDLNKCLLTLVESALRRNILMQIGQNK
jgi:hypothetical protein